MFDRGDDGRVGVVALVSVRDVGVDQRVVCRNDAQLRIALLDAVIIGPQPSANVHQLFSSCRASICQRTWRLAPRPM